MMRASSSFDPIERIRFLTAIVDAVPALVAYWDASLHCRFANTAYIEWFGRSPASMLGIEMRALLGEELFALNQPYIEGALRGERQQFERTLQKVDGTYGYTLATYIPDIDPQGAVLGFFVLVSDITAIKKAEAGRRVAENILRSTSEAVIIMDSQSRILSVNPAFCQMTGFTSDEATGATMQIIQASPNAAFAEALWREVAESGHWSGEILCRRKNGDTFPAWQLVNAIEAVPGEPARYASILNDMTEQWKSNERLRYLAFHDVLTHLPNRQVLDERLNQLCSIAERDGRPLAVLFLDLDDFKDINDSLGHDAGDELLQHVADVLRSKVRKTDTVARMGGDEFVVLLDNPSNRDEVARIAAGIVEAVERPFELRGTSIAIRVSIGIAMSPRDGTTASDLLHHADAAMYRIKRSGKGAFAFYDAREEGK